MSGRLLQTICLHFLGPDVAMESGRDNSDGDEHSVTADVAASYVTSSKSTGGGVRQTRRRPVWRRRSRTVSQVLGESEGEREGSLGQLAAEMPSSARYDAANRYLEVCFWVAEYMMLRVVFVF